MMHQTYQEAVFAFERQLQERIRAQKGLTWEECLVIVATTPPPSPESRLDALPPGLRHPSGIEKLHVTPEMLAMMYRSAYQAFRSPPPVEPVTAALVEESRARVARYLDVDLSGVEVMILPGEGNPQEDAALIGNEAGAPLLIFPSHRREADLMVVRAMAMAAHHVSRRAHGDAGHLYVDGISEEFVASMVAIPHLISTRDAAHVVFGLRAFLKGMLAIALEMFAREGDQRPPSSIAELKASPHGACLRGIPDELLDPMVEEMLADPSIHHDAFEMVVGVSLAMFLCPWREYLREFMAMNTIARSLDDKICSAFSENTPDVFEMAGPILRRRLAEAEEVNGTPEGEALFGRSPRQVVH